MKKIRIFLFILISLLGVSFVTGCSANNDNPEEVFVTFLNYDNTILQHKRISYGSIVNYEGDIPYKEPTEKEVYEFSGWDKDTNVPCYNDTIFKAQYDSSIREYVVTFQNYDGTILGYSNIEYGGTAYYSGNTPLKESNNDRVEYLFNGWNEDISSYKIYNDTTLIAVYKEVNYVYATFKYENDEQYDYVCKTEVGTAPNVEMYYPYYEENDVARYVEGFDKDLDIPIYEDTVYNAIWVEKNIYDVVFKMNDGTVLYQTKVLEGDDAEYKGYTPTKPSYTSGDYEYTYEFCGWNKSLTNIQEHTTFIAEFIRESEYVGYKNLVAEIKKDVKNQGVYDDGIYTFIFSIDFSDDYMYTGMLDYDPLTDELSLFYANVKNDNSRGSWVKIYIPDDYDADYFFDYKFVSPTVNNDGSGEFYAPTFTSSSSVDFSWHTGDWTEYVSSSYCALLISMALDKFASSSTYDMSKLGFNNYNY